MSGLAFYLQPVLREFTKLFPSTILFTGEWPGYVPGCEKTFKVELVGKSRHLKWKWQRKDAGYARGFHLLSPALIPKLLKFDPTIIFVNGLNLWTLLVILLKPIKQWKVVLVYSGSSPNVDMDDAKLRQFIRQQMVRCIDGAITNSQAGKTYLTKALGIDPKYVFARPYQMPDKTALLAPNEAAQALSNGLPRPIFLFIGQTIQRKGIPCLLEACKFLESIGEQQYGVIVIGDGDQRQALEQQTQNMGLGDRVKWVGWVEYGKLGSYFQAVDVFVFPTLEDIWGMVVLEAMLFGKPILCSRGSGAKEMIIPGENGFIFDPNQPQELAEYMQKVIQNPELMASMGERSQQLIAPHHPEAIASNLAQILNSLQES
jgi:glycosyltransferase involved in cell wall biosynthesis